MKKSVLLAFAIAIIAVLWLGFGIFTREPEPLPPTLAAQQHNGGAKDTSDTAKDIAEVRVKTMRAENYEQRLSVNGRTIASKKVNLSAEIAGRIIDMPYSEGDSVKQGDIIARIDPKDRAERVSEAKHILKQRQIEYNAAKSLEHKGFNSKISLAKAASNLESAKADMKTAKDALEKTVITAAFDGILSDKKIEVGDYVSIGASIITLAQLDPIKITAFVTERNIRDIEKGSPATIFIREKEIGPGIITYTSAIADDISRTFEIEITMDNKDLTLIDGLTVEVSIPLKSRLAYKISPSALTLGPKGEIGVKLANDTNIVTFAAVEMLSDTSHFSWVGGLPDKIRLITLGQDFVNTGSQINPLEEPLSLGKERLDIDEVNE